ncbi:MAG TPA: cholesterol oxidase substrate-binding domain-containing protein, partial [Enhygromyxa sp.]|nr:cholesterol oxidase substrate-binding domain-containing protein [Enhygromyxa sp.]
STQRREPLHNWSPLHLDERAADVLYVSFERITGVIEVERVDKRVRVYCGTQIADLARRLHAEGLTLPAIPAPGVISVGGAIAIGAHGSRLNDSEPGLFEWPGTISATIAEATVIAWNGERYVAKRLSQGMPELAFASVNLGRVLLVDVTLRVREDYCLFVEFTRHQANVLLGAEQSPNSLSELLKHQNMEVLGFRAVPGTAPRMHGIAWRSTTRPPGDWRRETFLNKFVQARGALTSLVEQLPWKLIARQAHMKADALLDSNSVGDFEIGPAAAERIYVTSDTLKVEPLGWALVLPRRDLQTAAHRLYRESQRLLEHSSVSERVHQHLAFELRFAELDTMGQPPGALPPTLSVGAPVRGDGRHVVMWVNILTIQTRLTKEARAPYLRAFEEFLLAQANAEGWIARPEWSKGWAYGEREAWTWSAERMQRLLADSWPGDEHDASSWAFARATAWKLDPHGVFSTPFHDRLLPRL